MNFVIVPPKSTNGKMKKIKWKNTKHKHTYIISWSVIEWGGQNFLQKGLAVAMMIEEEAHFWIFTVHHHPHLD